MSIMPVQSLSSLYMSLVLFVANANSVFFYSLNKSLNIYFTSLTDNTVYNNTIIIYFCFFRRKVSAIKTFVAFACFCIHIFIFTYLYLYLFIFNYSKDSDNIQKALLRNSYSHTIFSYTTL